MAERMRKQRMNGKWWVNAMTKRSVKRRFILIVAVLLALSSGLVAAEQAGRDLALTESGLGARPMGMGGAFTAVANDANAVFWNPAGMMFASSFSAETMQTKLPSELNVYYLTAHFQSRQNTAQETPDSAWGFYWVNGMLPGIELRDGDETVTANPNEDMPESGYSTYQAHAVGASYASWLSKNVAIGLTVSGFFQLFENVEDGKGYGLSVTPGVLWLPDYQWAVGLVVRDAFNFQKWETGTNENFLPEARAGVSYSPWKELLLTGELRQKLDKRYVPTFHTGAEWRLFNVIGLRAGYNEDRFTAGCGFYIANAYLHYAYMGDVTDGIGDSHRVSLGLVF